MTTSVDRTLLAALLGLAEASTRAAHTKKVAACVGALDIVALVRDEALAGALAVAPGFPGVAGGPGWRRLFATCARPGWHREDVGYPGPHDSCPALAYATARGALVLLGEPRDEALTALLEAWPLVESALVAEHDAFCRAGELAVAREESSRANALARALDRAREDLEQQARTLQDAKTRAEAATRAKDQFLAMLGHELRNPLSPIVTALHLLRMRGQTSRELEIIGRQVQHLLRLVDDLLDVSRAVGGKLELRREHVDLGSVVERAIEMVSPLLERKRQRFGVIGEREGLIVDGDPARLAQVVSNLLTNASRYSPDDAGIRIALARDGANVTVRVEDEGCGMSEDVRAHVFDVFFQAEQSIERARGGLGVGLAIVQAIVTLHGGTVRAESDGPGRGSAFTVTLPTADTRAVNASVAGPPMPLHLRLPPGLRVLVVDDNEAATEMLAAALTAMGCTVSSAFDGPSALEVAERSQPEIALLDLGLPVMDGYELAQRLRARPWARALRLIAVSGYAQRSDQERAHRAGFDRHLAKPVPIERIATALAELARLTRADV